MSALQALPWLADPFAQAARELSAGRTPHAMLISSAPGGGLDEFAQELAALRLCFDPGDLDLGEKGACGQCKSCLLLRAGSHPDLQRLAPEGASAAIKVDAVRRLVETLAQTPQISPWKVVIITAAHRMNPNAANACLKVLEEPPGNSLLLLLSERPQLLLPTVRSRCVSLRLPPPTAAQSATYLQDRGLEPPLIEQALTELGNRPTEIAQWVEQDIWSAWQQAHEQIAALSAGRISAIEAANKLKGQDLPRLIDWLLEHLMKKMRNAALQQPAIFKRLNRPYRSLLQTRQDLNAGANPNPQLSLESLFVDWPTERG
ncbi:MAG: DNA polymerase III subunit delta' [Cellvibrionales bacterium]|nr:DNA polymerase III subunit delta' [Cellvibrionales bacterium]